MARSTRIECPDPVKLYRKLRSINPSPYTYLFEFGDLAIVGASPETLFNTYDRKLRVNPIAGTCPRGRTREEDDKYAKIMLGTNKERAEHVMLVDRAEMMCDPSAAPELYKWTISCPFSSTPMCSILRPQSPES